MKEDYIAFMPKPDVRTALRNLAVAFTHYNENHPHSALDITPRGNTGGSDIVNLRYKSCPEMEGQDQYDGVFEVLQWLLFLSAVPPVQLLTGWCVTVKVLPDISAISALTAVKHGSYSSLTPPLNPVRTRKSLIWP